MPLILMGLMIFLPFIIGKRIPPSFTKEKTKILNISKDELYKLLTNYENYPLWIKYLYQVKTEKTGAGCGNPPGFLCKCTVRGCVSHFPIGKRPFILSPTFRFLLSATAAG